MAPTVLLIHGLPERGFRPFQRLALIEQEVRHVSLSISRFQWFTLIRRSQDHLEQGTFGSSLAPLFQNHLHQDETIDPEADLIIIGYSAAGFIFYDWLLSPQTPEADKNRIALAIMLAAPYHCARGEAQLENTNLTIRVGEPVFTPAQVQEIANKLCGKLRVFLGGQDPTVRPEDALFSVVSPTLVPRCVEENPIPTATHLSVSFQKKVKLFSLTNLKNY